VFHVDKGRRATHFLAFRYNMLAEGGLTGRFRAIDLGDAGFGDAANTQGDI